MGYKRATAEQYNFPRRKAHKEDQVVGFMGGGRVHGTNAETQEWRRIWTNNIREMRQGKKDRNTFLHF